MSKGTGSGWAPVYRAVRRIPAGRVSTYGEVAERAGMPRAARQVGWALNALEAEDDVPWHRVVNARGEVSPRAEREIEDLQRALLESEGVAFDARGRIDLATYRWPARRKPKRTSSQDLSKEQSKKQPQKSSRKRTQKSASGAP